MVNSFCVFVEGKREETLEVAAVPLLYNEDPFLQIKTDVLVPTAQWEPVEKDAEENEEGDDDEEKEEEEVSIIPKLGK